MKNKKVLIAGIVIVLVIGLMTVLFLQRKGNGEKVNGKAFVAKKGNIVGFIEATGIIKAEVGSIVKVGTRATGTLVDLKYQVGDYVKKGDLIARIDDRELISNIQTAKAQIEEQKRDIDAKEAQLSYNKVNYERERRLLEKEFTTKDSVDKAKKELDMSAANLELAKAKLNQALENLKTLNIKLSYTKIYAPISGYVSAISTQQGETVVSGLSASYLITIIDPLKLEMWIYVDETDIGRVRKGMKVTYWVDAYPDKKFNGSVSMIYPQPEIKDNIVYYLAIVKISQADAAYLKPEMTTHVRVITDEKKGVLVVPNNAVKFEGGRNIVYVKTGKKVEKKTVGTGVRDDRMTEIVSGLKEGDVIIIPIPVSSNLSSPK